MGTSESITDGTVTSPRGGWLFVVLLLAVLLVLLRFAKWNSPDPQPPLRQSAQGWTPAQPVDAESVRLTIDFGNGATLEYAALPHQSEMTVATLLEAAREFRPGITFQQSGSGAGGFLQSLSGVANQGAGGRNWIFRVNDEHAHQSFCLEKVSPGSHVLWSFTDEQYNAGTSEAE